MSTLKPVGFVDPSSTTSKSSVGEPLKFWCSPVQDGAFTQPVYATSPDAINALVEALEGDSNLRILIDDLRPYAERTLGSLRIGMADVRSILALHAAALAAVKEGRS